MWWAAVGHPDLAQPEKTDPSEWIQIRSESRHFVLEVPIDEQYKSMERDDKTPRGSLLSKDRGHGEYKENQAKATSKGLIR